MVFRVPQLKQPIRRYLPIAAPGRRINSHPLRFLLMDSNDVLIQSRFKTLPRLLFAQQLQSPRQPVIAKIQAAHFLPKAPLQSS